MTNGGALVFMFTHPEHLKEATLTLSDPLCMFSSFLHKPAQVFAQFKFHTFVLGEFEIVIMGTNDVYVK